MTKQKGKGKKPFVYHHHDLGKTNIIHLPLCHLADDITSTEYINMLCKQI